MTIDNFSPKVQRLNDNLQKLGRAELETLLIDWMQNTTPVYQLSRTLQAYKTLKLSMLKPLVVENANDAQKVLEMIQNKEAFAAARFSESRAHLFRDSDRWYFKSFFDPMNLSGALENIVRQANELYRKQNILQASRIMEDWISLNIHVESMLKEPENYSLSVGQFYNYQGNALRYSENCLSGLFFFHQARPEENLMSFWKKCRLKTDGWLKSLLNIRTVLFYVPEEQIDSFLADLLVSYFETSKDPDTEKEKIWNFLSSQVSSNLTDSQIRNLLQNVKYEFFLKDDKTAGFWLEYLKPQEALDYLYKTCTSHQKELPEASVYKLGAHYSAKAGDDYFRFYFLSRNFQQEKSFDSFIPLYFEMMKQTGQNIAVLSFLYSSFNWTELEAGDYVCLFFARMLYKTVGSIGSIPEGLSANGFLFVLLFMLLCLDRDFEDPNHEKLMKIADVSLNLDLDEIHSMMPEAHFSDGREVITGMLELLKARAPLKAAEYKAALKGLSRLIDRIMKMDLDDIPLKVLDILLNSYSFFYQKYYREKAPNLDQWKQTIHGILDEEEDLDKSENSENPKELKIIYDDASLFEDDEDDYDDEDEDDYDDYPYVRYWW